MASADRQEVNFDRQEVNFDRQEVNLDRQEVDLEFPGVELKEHAPYNFLFLTTPAPSGYHGDNVTSSNLTTNQTFPPPPNYEFYQVSAIESFMKLLMEDISVLFLQFYSV